MNPNALDPFGKALLAYLNGDVDAELVLRRDDGTATPLPMSHFFREATEFTGIESAALGLCDGRILDIGAGTGLHSLVLQQRGLAVTAIDMSSQSVEIMQRRGVRDVRCADILAFADGPFDTLLMLGHGIGMVGTLAGLDRFLAHARGLVGEGGQVLLDSLDVRASDDPVHLAYQEANRIAGRYVGEIRMQFEFRGEPGPICGWLHVDSETLAEHARPFGWRCEIIRQEPSGDHLARLTRQAP